MLATKHWQNKPKDQPKKEEDNFPYPKTEIQEYNIFSNSHSTLLHTVFSPILCVCVCVRVMLYFVNSSDPTKHTYQTHEMNMVIIHLHLTVS
jgi:hypothetical protein